ncbi:MAG TPA: DUF4339 domain-containing protein [Bdellovibrionota bacterium]|nr:DUF4339 domain-containing protein [Bdellovibrionota bacterium]
MKVDPERQWFVYFKETESGPYSEPEMLQKIKGGVYDGTAFVFTDGMSDWELIKDTRLQQLHQASSATPSGAKKSTLVEREEPAGDGLIKENISAGPSLSDSTSKYQSVASAEPRVTNDKSPSKAVAAKRVSIGLKPVAALVFVALVGVGYILNRDLVDSYLSGERGEKVIDLSQTVTTTSTNPVAEQDTSVNWAELDAFVRIQDPQGPAFRIADKSLAGMRPVIVGAISPMLKMNRVTVAVFPDNDRSLYAVPPVWVWNVAVQNGYFSVGPHLSAGQDLLPGRYRVLVASQGKFLGDVGFELGVYPIGDALTARQGESRQQLGDIASKERTQIKSRMQTTDRLIKQAQALEPLAVEGKGKRRAWLEQRTSLVKDLGDLRDAQMKTVAGPMFFGAEETQVLNVVRSLDAYVEALEYFSYGGAEHVKLKLNTDLMALKTATTAAWQKLDLATKDLDARETLEPLRLDAGVIKNRILEESK